VKGDRIGPQIKLTKERILSTEKEIDIEEIE
jgi:hypothetical protein